MFAPAVWFVLSVVPPTLRNTVPSALATASASTLRLSDTAEITLTVTGTAPLRVELPKDLLDPGSAIGWQIAPVGNATVSPDGTTWVQKYKLSPFASGDELVVRFNPIRVNDTEVTPGYLTFKVETSLRQPTAADARPVTSIEQLPGPPTSDPPIIIAGLSLLTAFVLLLVVVLVAARKRKPKSLAPGEWVREQFGNLQAERLYGRLSEPDFVTRLAEVFLEYLTRRFGLNTERTTTAELLASADGMWDADTRDAVEKLLNACDAVKFAGKQPTAEDCEALAVQVSELVEQWESGNPPVSGTR